MSQGSVKTKALVNIAPGEKANIPDEPETAEKMRDSDAKWVQEILPLLGKKWCYLLNSGSTISTNFIFQNIL